MTDRVQIRYLIRSNAAAPASLCPMPHRHGAGPGRTMHLSASPCVVPRENPHMNPKKNAFTDASQLDEMNRAVWKTFGAKQKAVGEVPPELDDSLPRAQSTPLVGDAGLNTADMPPATE